MTNVYEINDLVDFLSEHGITAEQYMYCLLLYYDKKYSRIPGSYKVSRPLSKLYKYHNAVRKFDSDTLTTLEEKGFIRRTGRLVVPDHMEVTDKFEKTYLGTSLKYDNLDDVYPSSVPNFSHPSGPPIMLKLTNDSTALEKLYNRFVKTQKIHDRIIEAVIWGEKAGVINMSIEKFVNSKAWESLWEMMEKHNVNDDSHTVI